MKKQSLFKNEQGFTLPVVLLSTALVLLYLTSNLLAYSLDRKMTATLTEQLRAQTLFEMSYKKYNKEQLSHDNKEEYVEYVFPDGKTTIVTIQELDTVYIRFNVRTNNGYQYAVTKSLKSPSNSDSSHIPMEHRGFVYRLGISF